MLKTTRFDAADFLDTEKKQAAYITAALETGDADFVRDALGIVAKTRGMGQVAKTAELNRESLYKALGETGNPEFSTVMRVMRAWVLPWPLALHRPSERQRSAMRRSPQVMLPHRSGGWKKLVDQSIVRSFEWVDEFYTLQHKAILKIFSKQVLNTGTLRRSP